jgi:hypothetical protein
MVVGENVGVLVGAIALGAIHGIEPGHGWPVAASYALDQSNKWVYGFAASLIIGIGHLISSLAMVAAFFYAKSYFDFTQINDPIVILDGVAIGGPVSLVAGILLIVLGIREFRHGHAHSHGGDAHTHRETEAASSHDHSHSHSHDELSEASDRGLLGIAWFAFVLGFAHEEEFEIIALCAGSVYCLELMVAYALTVILGIVGLTMLLIAGYQRSEERVEQYTPYLPAFSAFVLCIMGVGFITGVF